MKNNQLINQITRKWGRLKTEKVTRKWGQLKTEKGVVLVYQAFPGVQENDSLIVCWIPEPAVKCETL